MTDNQTNIKNKNGRRTHIVLMFGLRGTGKTTLEQKFVKRELKRGGRVLVLIGDGQEYENVPEVSTEFPGRIAKYKGVRKMILTNSTTSQALDIIFDYFYDGLIVFADFRTFVAAATTQSLERLLVRSRHHMLDIIAVAHSPDRMPPAFFTYASKFILFKTSVSFNVRKRYLANVDYWIEKQNEVNKKAETNPYHYQIFKV